MLFSWWLHYFTFSPTPQKEYNFSTSSPTLAIVWFFITAIQTAVKWSLIGFDLHFPD